jgi:hypothetical protein
VTAAVWQTTSVGGTGTAVLDMLTIPVLATGKTLTGVQLNDINPFGSLQIDLSGLTVEMTAPAPTPQPQPTCDRPGNSCNTPAALNSQATKWQTPTAAPTAAATDSDTKHANNGHRTK